jgi:prephenate dehydratase
MTNHALKIGVSGGEGSFSQQAAQLYAREKQIGEFTIEYLISVEGVLSALEQGAIDLGIFPIENSNGGIVIEAVHAMAAHLFTIEKLFELDVRHCLLALPGVERSAIRSIVSHDQALKQCRMYLKRVWPLVELVEYRDTAEAARDLAGGALPKDAAVIAPRGCAELYGLNLLEEGVQDLKFNFTSFIAARVRP